MKANQYYISNYKANGILENFQPWKDWNVYTQEPLLRTQTEHFLMLGFAVNPFNPKEKMQHIVNYFEEVRFDSSKFWEKFNSLSGRFILMVHHQEKYFCLNDAFAQRQVFYIKDEKGITLTSSPKLYYDYTEKTFQIPKEIRPIVKSLHFKGKFEGWLPSSDFLDLQLKRLWANYYLPLSNLKVERIPFQPKKYNREELISLTEKMVRGGYLAVSTLYSNLFVGLTAGGDSRMLGAILKDEKPNFFTFYRNSDQATDCNIASQLAEKWSAHYQIFKVSGMNEDFMNSFYAQFLYPRKVDKHANFQYLKNEFPANSIIIAAYGGEEIRGSVAVANPYSHNVQSQEGILEFISYPKSNYLTREIQQWLHLLNNDTSSQIFEYFHWELRSSITCAWYSYEQDFTGVEMFNPFCNRFLVESFMQYEPAEKRNQWVLKEIVKKYSPEVQNIPINPVYGVKKMKEIILVFLPKKWAHKFVNSSGYAKLKRLIRSL